MLRQPNDRIRRDVDSAAAGNVVEDEPERGGFGDGGEVAKEALLARLIVVGRNEERAIHADFLRFLRVQDRSRVELEPVPAITRQRFRATFTASSIT